ncbi:MAG: 16S rRNA (guanine(966)-N(2))-methyltransferase RsmD [Treponema sp.]|nr:16S rRNA (guanine(966)-N(2))-methyltransferase RsmD [Spirochaetia bacterium]MDD7460290.1 16S rRNA (guanine(966)-N(2))-methyltransferase RsmD [Spirochaetales bacterium]MDY5810501.1 16S rRNA (guanine(966)-N(2))-methyltransferase RsmD [Treponema sp.]MEE1181878.1 16S rRNA (guanine(966)-N(2))-methyltransferase RsmD [Treponema sp.]
MRITGGKLKGRFTETPYGKMAIRPAMDKMRESVFAVLDPILEGKSFLDLFSGSGTIALEAVSHGATDVSLCEMDKSKAKIVFQNVKMAEEVGVRIKCHFMAVELYLKRCKEKYDFIFMDPPFPYKFRKELIETAGKRHMLNPGGKLLIHYPEEDALPDQIGNLVLTDKRIYGRSIVNFYEYTKEDSSVTETEGQNP